MKLKYPGKVVSYMTVPVVILGLFAGAAVAQVPQLGNPSTTSGVIVDVDPALYKIDAVYVTTEAEVHYAGQFLKQASASPDRFDASVSDAGGVFASASLTADGFRIRLGEVVIDSAKPITKEQAELLDAFSQSTQATSLRKLVQTLNLEVAPQERHYVAALAALVMFVDAGAGAPVQAANDCFGCCGPGCWGCTGCYTDACREHDQCVADHGHLRCLAGLIAATKSLIEECLLAAVANVVVLQ